MFLGAAVLIDRKREVVILSLVLISFGLGTLRYAVKDFHEIALPAPTGIVVSEPEDREHTRRFVYRSDNGEKAFVSTSLYSPVEYGDRVSVEGKVERPGVIEDEEGGRPFDYGKYLAKDDIYHTISFAEVEVLGKGEGHPVKAALLKAKRSFVTHAREILAEPYAGLLLGLVVAGKDALPKDLLEEFRRAGVIHIVVLSGFNITLIAEFLRRMFQKLFLVANFVRFPQGPAFAALLGVLIFVLMTGAEATVVRAAIMASVAIMAKLSGRAFSAPRALVFAAFLMLIENPKILVFDPSFQLSFLATLGLIYATPIVGSYLSHVPERFQIRETLAQTLGTQIFVLPLLIYSMGDVSLVSLPANLLILLVVPWAMLTGFLAVLLSYLSTIIAWPLSFATHLLLSYILSVAHFLGSLPFATLAVPDVSAWVIVFLYILLAYLLVFVFKRKLV